MATKRVLMNFSRVASLLRIVGELQFDGLVTEFCQSVSREEKVFEAINRGKFSLNCSRFGLDFSCVIVQENADKNDLKSSDKVARARNSYAFSCSNQFSRPQISHLIKTNLSAST